MRHSYFGIFLKVNFDRLDNFRQQKISILKSVALFIGIFIVLL